MYNFLIVKISVSNEHDYYHIDDVVYYRSGMSPEFIEKWLWYFQYLAALVKVHNPRRKVQFYYGPQMVKLGQEWHEYRRNVMIKSRRFKLKQLENCIVEDDLFHFKSEEIEHKKNEIKSQITSLERDEYPIPDFPEYINKIKRYCK